MRVNILHSTLNCMCPIATAGLASAIELDLHVIVEVLDSYNVLATPELASDMEAMEL